MLNDDLNYNAAVLARLVVLLRPELDEGEVFELCVKFLTMSSIGFDNLDMLVEIITGEHDCSVANQSLLLH